MFASLLDTVISLTSLIEEESDGLVSRGRRLDLAEIAEAKVRLVASLEVLTVQLDRERPTWKSDLSGEERASLADAISHLIDASAVNADILSRQIQLSTEMMAAVACEAQRLMGTNHGTYGAHGGFLQIDQATPISLNTRL